MRPGIQHFGIYAHRHALRDDESSLAAAALRDPGYLPKPENGECFDWIVEQFSGLGIIPDR